MALGAQHLDVLRLVLREAMVRPIPRRATKPTYGSKQRRLEGKSVRSAIKAGQITDQRLYARVR